MSQESNVSRDDRSPAEILQSYGWEADLPNSEIRKLWKQYWHKGLAPAPTQCPREWQEVLDYIGEDKDPDLIELAERFGVLHKEYSRKLPAIAYYDCRYIRKCQKRTDGRIIEREDYRRLYQEIRAIRDDQFESEVILTGQPNGGKTYFMYYFLIHLLARAEPVVLSQNADEHYLFLEDNVWKLKQAMTNPDSSSRRDFLHVIPEGTWALIDCDKLPDAPSHAFSSELIFFPVYFCPPYKTAYESLLASPHPPLLRVMRPMTSREIVACCSVLSSRAAPDKSAGALERLLKHFGIFGHAPKECLESMRGLKPLAAARDEALHTIRRIDIAQLQHILVSLNRTDLGSRDHTRVDVQWDKAFRALFTIHCSTGGGLWSDRISLSFASPWMIERLIENFMLKQRDQTRTLVSILLQDHRKLATATGVMFESMMHHILSTVPEEYQGRFELKEFDLGNSPAREKDNPHALSIPHIFRKRTVEWYFTRRPPEFDLEAYFVPVASNNPTFDAIVYDRTTCEIVDDTIRGRTGGHAHDSRRSVSAMTSGATVCDDDDIEASNIDFERATAWFGGRSASARSRASSSIPPAGPSPTPFESSRSRSHSHMTSKRPLSRPRMWAPDETSPGVKIIKRKRSALDRPPSSRTGNKVPTEWDDTQHCIALQMTVAATHSVALTGLNLLNKAFEPRRGTWSFVFVTPKSRPIDWNAQIDIIMALPDNWHDSFRWYNLIVDITNPGYLDLDINTTDTESDTDRLGESDTDV